MRSDDANEAASSAYILEARNIVKLFGDLRANDDIDLSLKPGEIHALLGENGAGKSTLVKIIYGALQPTSGELFWNGSPVTISNPAAARELGIGMVFQHFSLFEALTVGRRTSPCALDDGAPISEHRWPRRIEALSFRLRPAASARTRWWRTSRWANASASRSCAACLQEPRLLILDEPTAVLTPQEADQLFVTLERLASEGCAVLYISHRLDEVKRLCHDATILRHGTPGGACRSEAGIRRVARQAS